MGYIIDLCGELKEVELSFFSKIKVMRHDTIGSVHFIVGVGIRGFTIYGTTYTFSIADNIWQQVQSDLRDKKIDEIIS
jgi:hypothetical protein